MKNTTIALLAASAISFSSVAYTKGFEGHWNFQPFIQNTSTNTFQAADPEAASVYVGEKADASADDNVGNFSSTATDEADTAQNDKSDDTQTTDSSNQSANNNTEDTQKSGNFNKTEKSSSKTHNGKFHKSHKADAAKSHKAKSCKQEITKIELQAEQIDFYLTEYKKHGAMIAELRAKNKELENQKNGASSYDDAANSKWFAQLTIVNAKLADAKDKLSTAIYANKNDEGNAWTSREELNISLEVFHMEIEKLYAVERNASDRAEIDVFTALQKKMVARADEIGNQ